MRRFITRDIIGALLVVSVGVSFVLGALSHQIGTIVKMGSGYFPLIAGILTIAFGVLMAAGELLRNRPAIHAVARDGVKPRRISLFSGWATALRAAAVISAGIVVFAVCLSYFGFVPAVFFCTLICAYADRQARFIGALLTAVAMAALSWLVFVAGLELAASAFRGVL